MFLFIFQSPFNKFTFQKFSAIAKIINFQKNLRPCSLCCFQPVLSFQFFKTLKTRSLCYFQKRIFENKEKICKENAKRLFVVLGVFNKNTLKIQNTENTPQPHSISHFSYKLTFYNFFILLFIIFFNIYVIDNLNLKINVKF